MKTKFQLKMQHPKISQWCFYEKFVKDHPNFETKTNKVPKNEEEWMKLDLQIFHVQKIKWKHHGKNCFFCVNNYQNVDRKIP
jgi:hypothetical protein